VSVRDSLEQVANNPKVAGAVATITSGTGAGTVFDWIPTDIGKLATLIGIILSVILIKVHLVNLKKANLELEILKKEAKGRSHKSQDDQSHYPNQGKSSPGAD
jgi:hypothetical protein